MNSYGEPMHILKSIIIVAFLFISCLAGEVLQSRLDKIGPETETIDMDRYQSVIYVSEISGSDINGKGTAEQPWQTIKKALTQITGNSEHNRIAVFVGQGRYQSGTLEMKQYTDLYGGFSEKKWQRDIYQYKTFLSGNSQNRVLIAADHSILDGFIIADGRVRGHGAGILCDDTSPEISNNILIDNMTLAPENFNHNRIHQEGNQGGGIACLFNAVPVIRNNIFYQNKTGIGMGAGIAVYGWVRVKGGPEARFVDNRMVDGLRAKIENNVFLENNSGINDTGRTRSSNGAAIGCAYEARPVIQNNLILNNNAHGRSDAGGVYVEYFSFPDIIENYILGNSSDDDGGGIYAMRSSHPLIKDNFIAGNYTQGGGPGGVRLSKEGRGSITGNTIVYNPGGGVLSVDSYLDLTGNIIMDNPGGYGVTVRSVYSYFPATQISKNQFKNNEKGAVEIAKDISVKPVIDKNNMFNIAESWSAENFDSNYQYSRNPVKGTIIELSSDDSRYVSTLKLSPGENLNMVKNGDVIKIGKYWSVIKSINENSIEIWGQVKPEVISGEEFFILPSY